MGKTKRFKKFLIKISVFNVIMLIGLLGIFSYIYYKIPLNVEALTEINNGILVSAESSADKGLFNTNRSLIEIDSLPEYVKNAFVDTEDKRFYSHHGFDSKRIIKAMLVNILNNDKSEGASTISQQLIKNTLLDNKKTYKRKLKELILSIKMEKQFSKDEILEMYLNTIYFGSGAYGLENASLIYFNKSAADLTPSEACTLAGIIKSPKFYNPKTNIDNATKRRNLVAKNMYNLNHIDDQIYNEILASEIKLNTSEHNDSYEQEAIYEACSLLNMTERELINNGMQIITHQDTDLQNTIDSLLSNKINDIAEKNVSGLTIITDHAGHILCFSANSDYSLHNLKRQSASILKPLAVYLPCFTHNILSPADVILDEPINYSGYSPENADKKYHGYVSVREAISTSLNIPAVKSLDYVGIKKSKATLTSLGININEKDQNLTLALGATTNGIKLLDILGAYNTISNGGMKYTPCFVKKILDKSGNEIYSCEDFCEKVLDEADTYLLTSCLKDTAKNGTARRLNDLNLNIASKTGTASIDGLNTNLYNITYSTEHTILTWIGDLTNKGLPVGLKSSNLPTDINKAILKKLYSYHTPEDFDLPDSVELMPFSADELNLNHRLVLDKNSNLKDYFKKSNPPIVMLNKFDLNVSLNKFGAEISFDVQDKNISLIKRIKNVEYILIDDLQGTTSFFDRNIYTETEIEYYLKKSDKICSDIIKIKPQNELLEGINRSLSTSKRKWQI